MRRVIVGAVLGLLLAADVSAQGNSGNGGNSRDPKPFRVIDRSGKLVGFAVTESIVVREINGELVSFYIHPVSGIFDSEAIYTYYDSTDCSGPAYLPRYRVFLEGVRVGSRLYYPTESAVVSPRSNRILSESFIYDTTCHAIAPSPYLFGLASSIDVVGLGLELPFKAVQ